MILRHPRLARQSRRGFTLLEILMVVAIIVVLAGLGAYYLIPMLSQSEEDTAKIKAKGLDLPVQSYYLKHHQWPSTLQVLTQADELNANSPYVPDDGILDPWGNEYQINTAGPNNKGAKPDIFTTSPSGKTLGNWMK
jgi:general secretion pathway protein G